ncbi:AAT-domain-containing protein [Annulohypoxylon maeteangense]|uniref:AAT-domain-containing protein n=1 Tax=Annulohypoxylon maeteangense TaxID=1927788 RepID=UPI002007CD58|nr:AAT-domain-containing protein [Annulohypoxylon maeteangense]KAI0880178.1 AAT-domain-containing protein [Annulohypoxylon maeteangense]
MLEIRCDGTPYEIGLKHGKAAKERIERSIQFYGQLFQESCSMSWAEVLQEASIYVEPLKKIAPRYLTEIEGIADGANIPFLDILALNVRSEITFGLFTDKSRGLTDVPSDGCTSLGWLTESTSFLCQNWDWRVEQGQNLVVCYISQPDRDIPDIAMVTEAGIIGKIGFNSKGVGCCLNAIRCRGLDRTKLPIHFALRTALESRSREEAVALIKSFGVAGGGHILVGDLTGSTGLECTNLWVKELAMDKEGRVCHTNHLVLDKSDIDEPPWLMDSPIRLERIRELTSNLEEYTVDTMFELFKDTKGHPTSINRKQEGDNKPETLFSIIMDLTRNYAQVTFGRPTKYSERIMLVL